MNNLYADLEKPLLILGPTGSGKSSLVKQIHQNSKFADKNFMTLNLASVHDETIESELYGHIKGAFTGAVQERKGFLEEVNDGILFLDEIGEMNLEAQKKLLRVLDEREFCPLGSCQSRPFKGRIIMATHRDLKELVKKKLFREDLYYRIMVFVLELPALNHSLLNLEHEILKAFHEFKLKNNRHDLDIDKNLIQRLLSHSWPGNYRELRNCIEHIVFHAKTLATLEDLPPWLKIDQLQEMAGDQLVVKVSGHFQRDKEEFEKQYLLKALKKSQGKVNQASRVFNINKSTLLHKIAKYGINTWKIKSDIIDKGLIHKAH